MQLPWVASVICHTSVHHKRGGGGSWEICRELWGLFLGDREEQAQRLLAWCITGQEKGDQRSVSIH